MTYSALAWKNLVRRPVRTALTAGGVALAVAVAVSLGGFNLGYRQAIAGSIEQLGFQVVVMAKGCPYEAATLMLKGGTGLLYLPEEAHAQIRTDPDIEVEMAPQDYVAGRDPQLDRAVAEALRLLAERPELKPDIATRPSRALPKLPQRG